MEYILSPSILSADFARLGEDVKKRQTPEPSGFILMLWTVLLFRIFL